MNRIRLATQEEADSIKDFSDLDTGCTVFALNTQNGVGLAVRRLCQEVDPLVAPEGWNTRDRTIFVRDLETVIAAQGGTHYYFNVDADDQTWQDVVKHWGAEQVSKSPVLRFKKIL
jgi:hypothetical protein